MFDEAQQLVDLDQYICAIGDEPDLSSIYSYEQWTVNLFILSVFGEIVGIVLIIVKYLFTPTNKEMIDLIKDQR